MDSWDSDDDESRLRRMIIAAKNDAKHKEFFTSPSLSWSCWRVTDSNGSVKMLSSTLRPRRPANFTNRLRLSSKDGSDSSPPAAGSTQWGRCSFMVVIRSSAGGPESRLTSESMSNGHCKPCDTPISITCRWLWPSNTCRRVWLETVWMSWCQGLSSWNLMRARCTVLGPNLRTCSRNGPK